MRRRWTVAQVALIMLAVVSCGSDLEQPGPLSPIFGSDATCAPSAIGAPFTFGSILLDNPSDDALTIDKVTLLDADGLELIQAAAVPDRAKPGEPALRVGAVSGYPPNDTSRQTLDWSALVDVRGLVLAPHGPALTTKLVLGVKTTKPVGSTSSVEVLYHDDGQRYRKVIESAFTLVDPATGMDCDDVDDAPLNTE